MTSTRVAVGRSIQSIELTDDSSSKGRTVTSPRERLGEYMLVLTLVACLATVTAAGATSTPPSSTPEASKPARMLAAPSSSSLARDNRVATAIGGGAQDGQQPDAATVASRLSQKDYERAFEEANKLIAADPKSPVGYNMLGGAYLGRGDPANARKSFEKALALQKNYVFALMNLAQLDVMQKDYASARKRYQAVLATEPKSVPAMVGLARIEAQNNKDKEGLEWLARAKTADPAALSPRLLLGTYYLQRGDSSQALLELNEAARFHPESPELLNLLGQAEFASGQKAAAVRTYRRWVAAAPQSAMAHFRLAAAQVADNDPVGAEQSLKRALQINPTFSEASEALGSLILRSGRGAEALKIAKDLQATAPSVPAGFMLEGDVSMANGQPAAAIGAYQQALALGPSTAGTVKLHEALLRAGKPKEATDQLQRWVDGHPEDLAARHQLASTYLQTGQAKVAIEQYQIIVKKDPRNLPALNNLANLYHAQNDPRAIETAEAAYRLGPDLPGVMDTLGWILVQRGDRNRGLELLRTAAAAAPREKEIRFHLAAALVRTGNKAAARKELESLLAGGAAFPQRSEAESLLKQL